MDCVSIHGVRRVRAVHLALNKVHERRLAFATAAPLSAALASIATTLFAKQGFAASCSAIF